MNIRVSRAFALPTVLIISIIMLSVLVSAVSSTSSTRVALMNQHYDELSRQAADAGVVYAKACIVAEATKTPQWSDAKPLKPNTDCKGDVTHVCPETSTDPECSVLVADNNKTITSFSVPRPTADSKGAYKDIHANGHTKLFRTNGELWRDYASKSSTPLASLLKVDLPDCTSLADCTWEEVGIIANAGKGDDYFNIGDTKDMTLTTGEVLTMQIYDFNHDDKSDGTGKTNITFGTKNLMAATRRMNPNLNNDGGWDMSEMRSWVSGTLYGQIPANILKNIKTVNKSTATSGTSSTIIVSVDKVFLFSQIEIAGVYNRSYVGEGSLYLIFTNDTSRIKYLSNGSGSASMYWDRSPHVSVDNHTFVTTGMSGSSSGYDANQTHGVAFGFALGNAPKYSITFNSNGGSNVSTQNIEINKTITKPADPTKSGNVFLGWYKDAAYTTAWNFTTDKVTADTTLYAKWMTMPAIGTPLESFTWEQIAYISESGQADNYFNIGDTKNITLSTSEVLTMQIYDFNHDDKSDGSGKAGITFGLKNLTTGTMWINTPNTNIGGWNSSEIRTFLNSIMYSYLPSDVRGCIESVDKKTSSGNASSIIITSSDKLFLLSEIEVFGFINFSFNGEGGQYQIFTSGTNHVKKTSDGSGSNGAWWTRSPNKITSDSFVYVGSSGLNLTLSAQNPMYYVFGFAI